MLREDWRKVGEALLVGRKLHKSDKLFGKWCKDSGFSDLDRRDRADAMWLVENWATVGNLDSSQITYNRPGDIRQAYREATKGKSSEPANDDNTPREMSKEEAEKLTKIAALMDAHEADDGKIPMRWDFTLSALQGTASKKNTCVHFTPFLGNPL